MQMLGLNFTPTLSTIEMQCDWLQDASELQLQLKSSEFGDRMYCLESSSMRWELDVSLVTSQVTFCFVNLGMIKT